MRLKQLDKVAVSALRVAGGDTRKIMWNESGWMGIYYVEKVTPP